MSNHPPSDEKGLLTRLGRWSREWIGTWRVAPPFSRRRRGLLASIADTRWLDEAVEVERPTPFDQPWRVDLQCCGRHFVTEFFADWETADQFRESYCTGIAVDPHGYSGDGHSGHQRAGIVTDTRVLPPERTSAADD